MRRLALCLGLVLGGTSMVNAQWSPTILSTNGYFQVGAGGISSIGAAGYGVVANSQHALYWQAGTTNPIDLNPTSFDSSAARFCVGGYQYGVGSSFFGADQNYESHALMWHGSAESAVDFHPGGTWTGSEFQAATLNSQIGIGYRSDAPDARALLWHGSAASAVDLTPDGAMRAIGLGGTDDTQVGAVRFGNSTDHAVLWHGTKESVVDLEPSWSHGSFAFGAYGNRQVGYCGTIDGDGNYFYHATIWNGTSTSAIDLNHSGLDESQAFDMAGNFQVGAGRGSSTGGQFHAFVWQGSADNYVDLQSTLVGLPINFTSSAAFGIDENGDIIGGGTDQNGYHIIRWTHVVPEPTSIFVLAVAVGMLLRRRKS